MARQGPGRGRRAVPSPARLVYLTLMIVRPRPTPLQLLFVLQGSILPAIAARLGAVAVLSSAVAALSRWTPHLLPDVTPAPFALLGLALSIFLVFRNNACYDRWWEGRRQWGQLIAETRSAARDLGVLLPARPELVERCVRRLVAFAHALRSQLRGGPADAVAAWLPASEWDGVARGRSLPDAILLAQANEMRALMRRGALSDIAFQVLAGRMEAMTTIQTACERLRATPPPYAYSLLLHRTAWLFCLLLPFGLVGTLGFATPFACVLLAYCFFGLDALGDELEEPFGTRQNGLPLDAMVRTIEIAALQALSAPELPAPLEPRGGVLL